MAGMRTMKIELKLSTRFSSLLGHGTLAILAILFSLPAIRSPFWTGNDAWSNLLPIIHFRDAILNHQAFPNYTDLWYGGRFQWQNPLWSFFYLPATLIWLIAPLDIGMKTVYFLHLLFILFAAKKLSSRFFEIEIEQIAATILLVSPGLPAFIAGQTEKILSWGWVLLGLFFLLGREKSLSNNIWAGICLGIVPLTGSNYHAFYSGILFVLILLWQNSRKNFLFFSLGASIGLIHLPSIVYLIGHSRGNAEQSIQTIKLSLAGVFSSLSIGLAPPMGWETWAPIGIPIVYFFLKTIFIKTKRIILSRSTKEITQLEKPLLIAIIVFILFATGLAYEGHNLFDTFRVPARTLPFIALCVTIFTFLQLLGNFPPNLRKIYLLTSTIQVLLLSSMIRPEGAPFSPYDTDAQQLANILKMDNAESIWLSMGELNDMYIQVVLTDNGIQLPNVYYGDMGQQVKITGNFCGYSFDHLVVQTPITNSEIDLIADMEWSQTRGKIPLEDLSPLAEVNINGKSYLTYRVVCNAEGR